MSAAQPPIEVHFPDLARWAPGNAGIPYVWTFAAERAGPHVLVQAPVSYTHLRAHET